MKHIFKLLAIVLLFQSFQCDDDNSVNDITPEELTQKKTEITNYIATFPCEESIGCDFIAFGSKPCGGPWEYLVFSNAVDQNYLTEQVLMYNEMQHQYNIQSGAVSDCAFVNPPTNVGCIDGVCGIIP